MSLSNLAVVFARKRVLACITQLITPLYSMSLAVSSRHWSNDSHGQHVQRTSVRAHLVERAAPRRCASVWQSHSCAIWCLVEKCVVFVFLFGLCACVCVENNSIILLFCCEKVRENKCVPLVIVNEVSQHLLFHRTMNDRKAVVLLVSYDCVIF